MSREIRVHYQINDRRIPAILVNVNRPFLEGPR